MEKRLFFGLIAIISMSFWVSCGPSKDEGFISEGAITYDAEVVDTDNPMASLAPSKMTVKFKNNRSSAEMNAGMGLLSTSFISNPESKTFTQLIKLMNKKFSVVQDAAEIKKENELYNLEVIPTKQTKMIAGYNCKKAIIHYKGGEPSDYEVFYTTGINIKNSNFANPYYMIDGVLMEYKIKKFGLEMKFTAKSVTKVCIDDAVFELPNDYKKITEAEMTDLFIDLQ